MRAACRADFASAAERHALRRRHHRARRVLDGHVHALELPHRQMNIVPFAFLRAHQQQHQVRAHRKIRSPGWRSPWLQIRFPAARRPRAAWRRCRRRWRSSWSGIRSTARRRPKSIRLAPGVFLHDRRAILQRFQNDDSRRLRERLVRALARRRSNASRPFFVS